MEQELTHSEFAIEDGYAVKTGRYYVERCYIDAGWDNITPEDPTYCETLEDAIQQIKDLYKDQVEAVEAGYMEDHEDPADFRVTDDEGNIYSYAGGMDYKKIAKAKGGAA